jgi:hypothetical protein
MSYEEHYFYCLKCGNKGIPLMRESGFQHERFHRKRLYCPYCKQEVNHIECKNQEDVEEFLNNFKNGVYKDEAEESISFVRNPWQRKNDMGKK